MKNIHIVPHMHWDREWYFTTEESRILLVNNMSEIMEILENNPDYPYYVLDGQTAVLEDYFAVCPEEKSRVKTLVQQDRLIIGPWYTQTDELVVGAESITRNLLYGMKDSKEIGEPMMIGYLPDSFGQSGQMPQILNEFGINRAIFWRGTSERHGTDKTEFYWIGNDGSKVLTQLFPLGYAIGKYLPENEELLQERMDKYFSVLDKGATGQEEIIPNGHDQMPIQKNIFKVIKKLEELYPERKFFLSRYENVFEVLEKQNNLPVIKGEFIDGKYSRVHRSIFSTRMDIKAANARIENKITNLLEPIASIAYSLGHTYHHGLIEGIWKEIMKNHAHDSIGCCCSDKVHYEIMGRFINAEERVDRLIEFYQRRIVEGIPGEPGIDKLVSFNLLPSVRTEVITTKVISKLKNFRLVNQFDQKIDYELLHKKIIDPGLIDRQIVHYGNYEPFIEYTIRFSQEIPAMGYNTLYILPEKESVKSVSSESESIDSDYFTIVGNENGTITLKDKRDGTVYDNILSLENMGDDGDEYDFSPLKFDEPRLSKNEVKASVKHKQDSVMGSLDIKYEWGLPKDLDARRQKKDNGKISVHIHLGVPKNNPVIELDITIDNRCKDHRTRLLIPTSIESEFSIADNQFGILKRKVIDEAMDYWEADGWVERPDPIYPFLSHVSLGNDKKTVSVFTNSSREYEIIGPSFDCLAITLFRSIGVLGKANLLRRPGRPSGIKLPTPDSQLQKKLNLSFGIYFSDCSYDASFVANHAKRFLTPVISYNQIPYNAMKLNPTPASSPAEFSLFEQIDEGIVLSTVKKAEEREEILARFFNPSFGEKILKLEGESQYRCYRLNEDYSSNQRNVILKANKVTTIQIRV